MKKRNKTKKELIKEIRNNNILLFITVIVLIFATTVLILTNYDKIIKNHIESVILTEENIKDTIYIDKKVDEKINDMYEKSYKEGKEDVLCLSGFIDENGYIFVNKVKSPSDKIRNSKSVTFKPCIDSIGSVHSHISYVCKLSLSDVYSFGVTESIIEGVICGKNKYVFHTPNSLSVPLNVEVI